MEVYIGGCSQGKLNYVVSKYPDRGNIIDGRTASEEACVNADVINHFHLYIKQFGEDEVACRESVERIIANNPQVIIISDEVGYGIVPMEKEERIYRENVGRIMCYVVSKSDHVERIICGIGTRLK